MLGSVFIIELLLHLPFNIGHEKVVRCARSAVGIGNLAAKRQDTIGELLSCSHSRSRSLDLECLSLFSPLLGELFCCHAAFAQRVDLVDLALAPCGLGTRKVAFAEKSTLPKQSDAFIEFFDPDSLQVRIVVY